MKGFERHDFVTLDAAWREHLAAPVAENAAQQIAAWQAAGRPFVVAARSHGDEDGSLRLGLAGPGKTRLGFAVSPASIAHHAPPPRLDEIAPALPAPWQSLLVALAALSREHRLGLRVFGSAAWQALTGLCYLFPASDLDLLIEPLPGVDLDKALSALAALEGSPRLDGEIRFAGCGDINWREWHTGAARVLAKTRLGPRLMARTEAA